MTFIKLLVFRGQELFRIVNLTDFSGTSENDMIYAFGFNDQFEPILQGDKRAMMRNAPKYQFSGSRIAGVELGTLSRTGLNMNGKMLFGFDALQAKISSQGLTVSAEKIKAEIKRLIDAGTDVIYIYRKSSLYLMREAYNFKDEWIFGGKPPTMDEEQAKAQKGTLMTFDQWNQFLRENKSPWRLYDAKVERLLRKQAYASLKDED